MATQAELEAQMKALQAQLAEASKEVPLVAKDKANHDVTIGDTVTLTLRVAGVHAVEHRDPQTGVIRQGHALNLSCNDWHLLTADSSLVEKA